MLVPVVAVIVLVLAGTFSGPDDSGTQSAAAAVIQVTKRVLGTSPGTIFVEDQSVSGPGTHGHPYTLHDVLETPERGPQNELTESTGPASSCGPGCVLAGFSYVGGTEEVYSPRSNTIYASSIWGPYLHPGPRPGTYVYRNTRGAATYTTTPVLVTAAQRRGLLSGQLTIGVTGKTVDGKFDVGPVAVQPALRGPTQYTQTIREELTAGLHLAGRTTVDGRAAIELAGRTTDGSAPGVRFYFDPATHLPFEIVSSVGTARQTTTRLHLRTLTLNADNERLLSLAVQHPSARIDRDHADYLRGSHGFQVYPG